MDDETQNPGADTEDDDIEMPPDPVTPSAAAKLASDAASARRELAYIDYTTAANDADAAAAAAFNAHVQAGAVDAARVGAADVHNTLQAAEKEAHDRAAGLDAAADAASLATDDALRAELEARDAYTKAIAEGDDAAIEAAWSAVENLTTLTDAHKVTRDGLRAAADAAAKDAEFADDVEDAAAEVAGPLGEADIRAEMAVDAYEAAHAEAGRAADAAREAYNQAIDAEKAALQAAAKAAAADAADAAQEGSIPWSDDESGPSAADVEHIEMPPEPAREQAKPPGPEAAPIKGETSSSRLMDGGGGALPTEDLRDEAFSGEEESEGAPDVAAASAESAEGVEVEMPPEYVGRTGAEAAAAQEPNNAPDPVAASPEELGQDATAADPWAGTPPPGTTEQAGAEIVEGVEIEMPLDPGAAAKPGDFEELGQEPPSGEAPTDVSTDQGGSPFWGDDETGPPDGDVLDYEQATAEGVEIEMPLDYVGQAGVDAGGVEIEVPPDPAETETPPEDHVEDVF